MASVTCGLTAEDRDQLQNPTFISSMELPLPGKLVASRDHVCKAKVSCTDCER